SGAEGPCQQRSDHRRAQPDRLLTVLGLVVLKQLGGVRPRRPRCQSPRLAAGRRECSTTRRSRATTPRHHKSFGDRAGARDDAPMLRLVLRNSALLLVPVALALPLGCNDDGSADAEAGTET